MEIGIVMFDADGSVTLTVRPNRHEYMMFLTCLCYRVEHDLSTPVMVPLRHRLLRYLRYIFLNGRRVHYFILCQNHMMLPLVFLLPPPPHNKKQCIALIFGRRRVAVAQYRRICFVLLIPNTCIHDNQFYSYVA